jgi:hypothetical protein
MASISFFSFLIALVTPPSFISCRPYGAHTVLIDSATQGIPTPASLARHSSFGFSCWRNRLSDIVRVMSRDSCSPLLLRGAHGFLRRCQRAGKARVEFACQSQQKRVECAAGAGVRVAVVLRMPIVLEPILAVQPNFRLFFHHNFACRFNPIAQGRVAASVAKEFPGCIYVAQT